MKILRKKMARIALAIMTVLAAPMIVFGETCQQGVCPTGDSFNYTIPLILIAVALVLGILALLMGKNKKKNDDKGKLDKMDDKSHSDKEDK